MTNIDALTYAGNLENLRSVDKNPKYTFVKGDICDASFVGKVLHGADTVVHFAAESHVDRSILDPSFFIQTNVLGTGVLLDQSLKEGIKRFHHVSTDEVFGALNLGEGTHFSEQTRYDPRSPYSASKAGSDHLVRAYFHTYGLPITITHCSNNYGPFQFPEKMIPLAITNALEDKSIPLYGDGLYVRDWLHVEDHCRAIECVLAKGRIGETYCIGGVTKDISNLEVIKKILTLTGKSESLISFVSDRPGHDRRYAVDWSKIKTELHWSPKYDFDTWLKDTVKWYQDNVSWWKRVKSGEYTKYYEMQYHLHT
jgi:dTDP-glucose 4,6-dehydratase